MELKERIIEEACKLFFTNGIRSITMNDIADRLGISKRTLYEVFRDKEALLEACIDKKMEEGDKEFELLLQDSDNVIDTMMRIYSKHLNDMHNASKATFYDLKKYHPQLYSKIECKQKNDVNIFIPLFERAVEQGLMRTDIRFEVLLWLLKAQFKTLMENNDIIPSEKYETHELVKAIILNFTRGIATPEGLKIIDDVVAKVNNKKEEN